MKEEIFFKAQGLSIRANMISHELAELDLILTKDSVKLVASAEVLQENGSRKVTFYCMNIDSIKSFLLKEREALIEELKLLNQEFESL